MGRELVEALLARPARVCVVNRGRRYWGTNDPSGGRVARVIADRRDAKEFAAAVNAATTRVGGRWDLVADFCAFNGQDIQTALAGLQGRFDVYVYISSDSVYEVSAWASDGWKPRVEQLVAEAADTRPDSSSERRRLRRADSYGDGKLEAEEALAEGLAKDEAASSRSVALRLPDVIGPFDDTKRLWAYWHWLRAGPEDPPQVCDVPAAKRARCSDHSEDRSPPADPQLAFVFSRDVARFITGLVRTERPSDAQRCDAVNLGCEQQVALSDMLALLAAGAGIDCPPPLKPTSRPRTFLPSVDRPWPLDLQRMRERYNFKPTPLEEVLRICAAWFAEACSTFPNEASTAAHKLPNVPAKAALARAGLKAGRVSSSSSSGSNSS